MNSLIIFVSAALTWITIPAASITENGYHLNKTKRGVIGQTYYYGQPATIRYLHTPIYHDLTGAAASIPSAANNYHNSPKPLVFHNPSVPVKPGVESEPPRVAVQQVLYEYQQPHNAAANIHLNQQFQPSTADANLGNPPFVNQPQVLQVAPNQFSGVATPVQHGAVIHHGQGFSKLLYGPLGAVQTTAAPLAPNDQGKYVYANGKIVYHPLPSAHGNNAYPGVTVPARPHNLVTNPGHHQRPAGAAEKPFKPSPLVPITHSTYQPHPKQPVKAAEAPVREEVEEEEPEGKSEVREEAEDEDEDDDRANYEEEEEDDSDGFRPRFRFDRYRFEDEEEEDDDRGRYRDQEDEEDEDNTRSHSSYVRKHPKKYTRGEAKPDDRYYKDDHYKYRGEYKTNKKFATTYKIPEDRFKTDSAQKRPKGEYKTYNYYKSSDNLKPTKELIEGRSSQHVPIVHKQKLFHQEKWLITKNES